MKSVAPNEDEVMERMATQLETKGEGVEDLVEDAARSKDAAVAEQRARLREQESKRKEDEAIFAEIRNGGSASESPNSGSTTSGRGRP